MFGIGFQEFLIILVIALLVFGPKRLPELARMLGRGMGEFRRASNDLRQSLSLDDLQNDIRRDFHSAKSMLKSDLTQKPSASDSGDRPAQAGDDVPTTKPDTETRVPERHQGELPLDNDYEHRSGVEAGAEPDEDGIAEAGGDAVASSSDSDGVGKRPGEATDSGRG